MATKSRIQLPSPKYLTELVSGSLQGPFKEAQIQSQRVYVLLRREYLPMGYDSNSNSFSIDEARYRPYEQHAEHFIVSRKHEEKAGFIPLTHSLMALLEFHEVNRKVEGKISPTCGGLFKVSLYSK